MKIESICNYDQFISYIKEELIRTLTSDEVIELLDRKLFDFNHILTNKHKTQFTLEIENPEKELSYYKYIFSITTRCGYYCSFYKILTNDPFVKFKGGFDKDKFENIINEYEITNVFLIFEGDYEEKSYINTIDIPKILYHISPQRQKSSILKIGLSPRSGGRMSFHPDRIYFLNSLDNYEYIVDEFRHIDFKNLKNKDIKNIDNKNINSQFYKYMLLKIDTDINNLKNKLILNSDPSSVKYGYFTTNNIPKENIEIIKENL